MLIAILFNFFNFTILCHYIYFLSKNIRPERHQLCKHISFHIYSFFTTTESIWAREEDSWLSIDTILMALVLGLLGTLFVLIVAIIIHTVKSNKN